MKNLSIFFVLLAAMLWGTTGTAQTFAPEQANPVVIGAVRLAVGGMALLLFVTIQGKLKLQNWPIAATIGAALSMAAYQPLFFQAVSVTGVAVGTVVAIGSAPILAGILEWIMKRKRPEMKWWTATAVAITGSLLLFTHANQGEVSISLVGIIMALGAGLSFAIYTLVSKQLLERQASEAVVAVVFTLSAIMLTPILFVYDLSWLFQSNGIGVALHLGLIATAVAYLLFVKGLSGIPASSAVTLSLAEPLTAAMLGVFLVGEHLPLLSWIGVMLLFVGLGILSYTPKKNKQPEWNKHVS
ncbi:EamA family transporter [Alkalihalobacillus sp. MEB130]|uniref:EamA family transporter n=1 Tax=Alkalihalobacillus sp. MEB130 TaxID=2976704 RepID=UPI0028DD422B|nr:EamA family transporter [Alkalihalobacillus sp. MEB130]MDT8861605.1 EamA family transporter [Alkalihalobacillus sp. MEB130]